MADQHGPYPQPQGPSDIRDRTSPYSNYPHTEERYQNCGNARQDGIFSQPSIGRVNHPHGPPLANSQLRRMQSQQAHLHYPGSPYEEDSIQGLQRGMRSMTMADQISGRNDIYNYNGRGISPDHEMQQPRYNGRDHFDTPPQQWHAGRGPQLSPQSYGEGYQPVRDNQQRSTQSYNYGEPVHPRYEEQPVPLQSIQRSMTMPSHVQYPLYNTGGAPPRETNIQPRPGQGSNIAPELQYSRESITDLLDTYYKDPETSDSINGGAPSAGPPYSLNDPRNGTSTHGRISIEAAPSSYPAYQKPNFSRPQPIASGPPMPLHISDNGYKPPSEFAQLALRSRSHPDLHSQTPQISYMSSNDAGTQVRAERPHYPVPMMPQYPRRTDSTLQKPGNTLPTVSPSVSGDSLPAHPEPEVIREFEGAQYGNHYNHVQSHPPPPIRPGLVMDMNHPPPQRQYDVEKDRPPPGPESGPVTHQELEQLASAVKMNPGDPKLHLTYAKKLVEAATVLASEGGRADVKTTRKNRENYTYEAHKIIKKLTNSSNPYPDAIFYLASCYGEGLLGLQIDHEKAYNLYQSAAKLGHGPSAYRTAVCSELGAGVRRDPLKAITWYRKAASMGETPAMFKLGMIQWKGLLGQPRNPRDGLIWLKRAADKADENNQHALHELALIYERPDASDVVIPDAAYARELFIKSAELGYPASQFRLGTAYEYGTMGCPVDPKKSIAWYSKAAMKGDLESQLALSGWYLTGSEGVLQQSDTEAYLWARKAAERGLSKAEYALGYFTEVGIGVPGNLEEAKRWYYKAASQGHPKAQGRLQELKKGGVAGAPKSRERLSRSNVKHTDQGDCVVM